MHRFVVFVAADAAVVDAEAATDAANRRLLPLRSSNDVNTIIY